MEVIRLRFLGKGSLPDPFKLITILKQTQVDNVEQVPSNQGTSSAWKTTLIVIPQYKIKHTEKRDWELRAILLSEKYGDSEYQEKEVVYTQFSRLLSYGRSDDRKTISRCGVQRYRYPKHKLDSRKNEGWPRKISLKPPFVTP